MNRVDEVRERVAAAAKRSGRAASDVRIVAVSKGVEVERIQEVVDAGIADVGENRVQELQAKVGAVHGARWHFVGALQTNKVRHMGPVELIHSLHRAEEAAALEKTRKPWDVLIEVNVSGEGSKHGVSPGDVPALLDRLDSFSLVSARGFMLMAPQAENPEDVRWLFAEGRTLRDQYEHRGLGELSMGMSDDYEVAIEEGATIVRIGRAIFGERTI